MPLIQGRYENSGYIPATMFAGRNRPMGIELPEDSTLINFDLILDESHGWDLEVSSHPVEEGSAFIDHIQEKVRTGSMNAYITNFGLQRGELVSNVAQEVFDTLEEFRTRKEPVNIVTTLKYYESYIITSVKAKRNGSTGEAQDFAISFQEFKTVQLKEVNVQTTDVKRPAPEKLKTSKDAQQVSPNANVGEQKPVRFFSEKSFPEFFEGGGV